MSATKTQENQSESTDVIKSIIKAMSTSNLTAAQVAEIKGNIQGLTNAEKDSLRQTMAQLGFFSKGSAWNMGILAELGDIFRPNIGAGPTTVAIGKTALMATGLATGGYFGYKGIRALLEGNASDAAGTSMLAAAATFDGASCGE